MPGMTKKELEEENEYLRTKLEKIEKDVADALGYDDDEDGGDDEDEDDR